MATELERLLSTCEHGNHGEAADAVRKLAAAGRFRELTDLGGQLGQRRQELASQSHRLGSLLDEVADTLARTPGAAAIEAALAVGALPDIAARELVEHCHPRAVTLAGTLANAQEPALLLDTLERAMQRPEWTLPDYYMAVTLPELTVHELAVRGARCAEHPAGQRTERNLRTRSHPLGWLPVTLDAIEDDYQGHTFTRFAGGMLDARPAETALDAALDRRLRAAEYQPGSAQVAVETLPGWFELDALTRLGADAGRPQEISPGSALARLLRAAANGGCYGFARGRAFGRLQAWTSAAALAGAPAGIDFAGAVAALRACRWFTLEGWSDCYEEVAVVALRPDRHTLASFLDSSTT